MLGESFENRESDRENEVDSLLLDLARRIEASREALDELTQAILTGTNVDLERQAKRRFGKVLAKISNDDRKLSFTVGSTNFEIQCWYEPRKTSPTIRLVTPGGLRDYDTGDELGMFKEAVLKKIAQAK